MLSQAGAFQSTHPLRGATQRIHEQMVLRAFQSTHPLRGATGRKRYVPSAVSVFQSTHPLRGATNGCGHGLSCPAGFQSTHPLRGATDPAHAADCNKKISIHAPLAGCDRSARSTETRMDDFNPRTPCGVRLMHGRALLEMNEFQSTHPLRGATATVAQHPAGTSTFQSTHPLRGATQENRRALRHLPISIHAPLAGCDMVCASALARALNFNPRTPCGVRPKLPASAWQKGHFNPRTPCGVRPAPWRICVKNGAFQSTHPLRGATKSPFTTKEKAAFQSTHPLRGATLVLALHFDFLNISIHAPLAGCDLSTHIRVAAEKNFNPRTPCGVRLAHERYSRAHRDISIHAPLAGCDAVAMASATSSV